MSNFFLFDVSQLKPTIKFYPLCQQQLNTYHTELRVRILPEKIIWITNLKPFGKNKNRNPSIKTKFLILIDGFFWITNPSSEKKTLLWGLAQLCNSKSISLNALKSSYKAWSSGRSRNWRMQTFFNGNKKIKVQKKNV